MNATALAGMAPGFADPVHESQNTFRIALDAMAHAGRVASLPLADGSIQAAPLNAAQAALLLALADYDTPLWLHPALRSSQLQAWLGFHCGAPLVSDSADASFIVLPDLASLPALTALRLGNHEYPDRSATILAAVPELAQQGPLRLTGPGINGSRSLYAGGWNAAVSNWRRDNFSRFPCGTDLILCCDTRIAALPRTTVVEG